MKREKLSQNAHTGICLGNDATLAAVDKIRNKFDLAAKNCKCLIEDRFRMKVEIPEEDIRNNEDQDVSRAMAASEANIED